MLVHVLLYEAGKAGEGIHSLELAGKTIVMMFENKDDAERYCGLLEAQDFPCPSVVNIERSEIELFCSQAGYESRYVESGFVPKTDEERLSLVPPQQNLETRSWNNPDESSLDDDKQNLDKIRKGLEDLL